MAIIESIYITSARGAPMQSVHECSLIAGQGIEGDRHYANAGTFSHWPKDHELTLVEAEAIEELADAGFVLSPDQSRRNLITRGIRLNHLVGQEFFIGNVRVQGTRLCEPCNHLERVTRLPGLVQAMKGRGGLRVVILGNGVIRAGDPISPAV